MNHEVAIVDCPKQLTQINYASFPPFPFLFFSPVADSIKKAEL